MNKRIFRAIFLTSIFTLIICLIFVSIVFGNYLNSQALEDLEHSASYIVEGVEESGTAYLENIADKSQQITYLSPDGTVIYDNYGNTASIAPFEYEDISDAVNKGVGTGSKNENGKRLFFYSVRMANGNILRISVPQSSTAMIISSVILPILLLGVVIFITSAMISAKVSKAITKPLNDLDIKNPSCLSSYTELAPLTKKLCEQNATIERQISDLKRKQTEFDTITKNMSEGFIIIDSFRNILSFNPAAIRLLGGDIGRDYRSVSQISDNETLKLSVIESLKGNHFEDKFFIGEKCYQIIASPVNNEELTVGAILLILDISEKNQREIMRQEFTANVSHELKTPLTSISGFAELMMNGMVKESDIPDFSATIYKESRRLITLVNDIIKISELDSRNAYEKDELDLLDVCDEVVNVLDDAAERKSIKMDLVGESVKIIGVKQIVFEMIYNICDNAIKYNKENGNVNIKLVKSDKKATVTVSDTGIGIPYDHQSRVFERFYRVDKSHSKQTGGTGLGLSIVKHGAMFHDADIHLESTPNVGTEISIAFKIE